jgi:SAM-dependent methyltransferase
MNPLIRKIFYFLPIPLRYAVRRIAYFPSDLFRKKNSLVPPKGLIFTGSGDYLGIGKTFLGYFIKYANITPEYSILDIGSGIGRMAIPLTNYLSPEGRYEGFDIVKKGVDWCNENISSRYSNFNFKLIPLRNDLYNNSTNEKAVNLKFPYENDSFDFVFLTSVFTHMIPEDVVNYITEIHRVLRKNKTCFITFFILDDQSENEMIKMGRKNFPHDNGNYALMDKKVREANVAYKKDFIFGLLKSHNFEITNFIRGNWSGIQSGELKEHQDIILIKKI